MTTREAPPPPVIGKAGNLTVFITPSPKKNPNPTFTSSPKSNLSTSPRFSFKLSPSEKLSPNPREEKTISPSPSASPKLSFNLSSSEKLTPKYKEEKTNLPSPVVVATPPPPVQVPPKQFEYDEGKKLNSHGSFGFFWDAVSRVQEAHSSLDEYLANWFGLDNSKYQWALNDYYEKTNPKEMETTKITTKTKEVIGKGQAV